MQDATWRTLENGDEVLVLIETDTAIVMGRVRLENETYVSRSIGRGKREEEHVHDSREKAKQWVLYRAIDWIERAGVLLRNLVQTSKEG